jgi:hypothetical protein
VSAVKTKVKELQRGTAKLMSGICVCICVQFGVVCMNESEWGLGGDREQERREGGREGGREETVGLWDLPQEPSK